jgi:hypothetical protein
MSKIEWDSMQLQANLECWLFPSIFENSKLHGGKASNHLCNSEQILGTLETVDPSILSHVCSLWWNSLFSRAQSEELSVDFLLVALCLSLLSNTPKR